MAEITTLSTPPTQPIRDEIASVLRDPLFEGYIGRSVQNIDKILRLESRGRGIDLYLDLELDGHLFSQLQMRYLAVVGREWDVLPASEAAEDQRIAAFVRAVLLGTNFDAGRMQMLTAIHRGYSVTEILWGLSPEGAVVIDRFVPRLPRRFVFGQEGELRLITHGNLLDGEPVPPQKFQVFTWGDQSGTRYGYGLGSKTYWPVWFKKNAIKFWVMFADKFGSPTAVGKYPPGTEKPKQDTLLAVLKTIQQETGLIIPNDMELSLLEAQRTGSLDTYERLCDFMDRMISKVVLGQTLTSEQGSVGSLALGQIHNQVRLELVKADADALAEALNGPDGVIRALVDYNFPGVQRYPALWTSVDRELDLEKQSQRDARLVTLGLPVSQQYFYETYSIPPPAPDATLMQAPRANGAPSPAMFASPSFALPAPATRAAREMAQQDALQAAALPQGEAAFIDLLAQVRRILHQGSMDLIRLRPLVTAAAGTVRAEQLGHALLAALLTSQLLGQAQIAADTPRAPSFATVELLPLEPLPPEEALAFFRDKVPLTPAEFDALVVEVRAAAFTIAGAQSRDLVTLVQEALQQALETGSTLPAFLDTVEALFTSRGLVAPGAFHIETVFRTNMQTAYQVGRYRQMQQGVNRRPYWQYHAVGDRRTRPTHAALSGKVFPAQHPFWNTWYPPNGFNCRCTVTSLSASELDEFGVTVETIDPTNQLIEPVDPQTGVHLPARPLLPDPGFASNPALARLGT